MSITGLSNGEIVCANCSNCKIIAYNDEELIQKLKTEDGNRSKKLKKWIV
jgi:hypothetical protein